MDVLETRARGEVPAVVGQQPGTEGQGNDSECKHSSPFSRPPARALEERRPRHSSAPVVGWTTPSFKKRRGARRNRRAPGTSSGWQHGDDGRLRPEMLCCQPVDGDREIADCSAANPRHNLSVSASSSLRICVICVICGQYAGADFMPSCLHVCDALLCVSLWFSRCLGGSPGCVGGKFEIRNSKFEI